MTTVGVTGAGGYVGGHLCRALRKKGYGVVQYDSMGKGIRPYTLGSVPDLSGVDLLVHCAYDFSVHSWEDIRRVNVEGTRTLVRAAAKRGIPTILISSMSAASDSLYGKAKRLLEPGTIAVRPGLVFGGMGGGMMGGLRKVAKLPIVPVIRAEIYPCHIDDLAAAIVAIVRKVSRGERLPEGPIVAASEVPCTLRDLVRRPRQLAIVLPPQPIVWGLGALEALGIRGRMRKDGILGLTTARKPDFRNTRKLGLTFRQFRPGN